MNSLNHALKEYKALLHTSSLTFAYRGLMNFMMTLRTHFIHRHPEWNVGSFHQGHMDISYFPLTTPLLQKEKLKVALIFHHPKIHFELWLCGKNKIIQKKFIEQLSRSTLGDYQLSSPSSFAILEQVIIPAPDFDHSDELIKSIDSRTISFIQGVHKLLN